MAQQGLNYFLVGNGIIGDSNYIIFYFYNCFRVVAFMISSSSSRASWNKYYSSELISAEEFEDFIRGTLMDDDKYTYKINHHADLLFLKRVVPKIRSI